MATQTTHQYRRLIPRTARRLLCGIGCLIHCLLLLVGGTTWHRTLSAAPPLPTPSPFALDTTPTPLSDNSDNNDDYSTIPSLPSLPSGESVEHAPLLLPNPVWQGRLLPSHGGWDTPQPVPHFMTLPFAPHPEMALLQGWFYDNSGLHSGVDYFKWDGNATFSSFPVLAVADGYVCGEWDPTDGNAPTMGGCVAGFGHRVMIRHDIQGHTFYTYYGHLDSIASFIPLGNRNDTVFVKRGQFVGDAGNTGTGGSAIHLHFGIFSPTLGWLDPYDLRMMHDVYPQPPTHPDAARAALFAGINHFWTANPPVYPDGYDVSNPHSRLRPGLEELWQPGFPSYEEPPVWQPGGAVMSPAHQATVAGTVAIQGEVHDADRTINNIEIWLDGELHQVIDNTPDGFYYAWDTRKMTDGVHTLQVRAVATDGMRALLPAAHDNTRNKLVVNVQNPQGALETPCDSNAVIRGTTLISGWVKAPGSTIARVEVWVDDVLHDTARYGVARDDMGGNYGFTWKWDTVPELNGIHTVQIHAVAENGGDAIIACNGKKTIPKQSSDNQPAHDVQMVHVANIRALPLDNWSIR